MTPDLAPKEEPVKKRPEKNKAGNALKAEPLPLQVNQPEEKPFEHELTVVEKEPIQPIVEEKPEEPVQLPVAEIQPEPKPVRAPKVIVPDTSGLELEIKTIERIP